MADFVVYVVVAAPLKPDEVPQNELSYWSLYIISILLGIYLPVFIAKIVEKIPNKLIRRCPDMLVIAEAF